MRRRRQAPRRRRQAGSRSGNIAASRSSALRRSWGGGLARRISQCFVVRNALPQWLPCSLTILAGAASRLPQLARGPRAAGTSLSAAALSSRSSTSGASARSAAGVTSVRRGARRAGAGIWPADRSLQALPSPWPAPCRGSSRLVSTAMIKAMSNERRTSAMSGKRRLVLSAARSSSAATPAGTSDGLRPGHGFRRVTASCRRPRRRFSGEHVVLREGVPRRPAGTRCVSAVYLKNLRRGLSAMAKSAAGHARLRARTRPLLAAVSGDRRVRRTGAGRVEPALDASLLAATGWVASMRRPSPGDQKACCQELLRHRGMATAGRPGWWGASSRLTRSATPPLIPEHAAQARMECHRCVPAGTGDHRRTSEALRHFGGAGASGADESTLETMQRVRFSAWPTGRLSSRFPVCPCRHSA